MSNMSVDQCRVELDLVEEKITALRQQKDELYSKKAIYEPLLQLRSDLGNRKWEHKQLTLRKKALMHGGFPSGPDAEDALRALTVQDYDRFITNLQEEIAAGVRDAKHEKESVKKVMALKAARDRATLVEATKTTTVSEDVAMIDKQLRASQNEIDILNKDVKIMESKMNKESKLPKFDFKKWVEERDVLKKKLDAAFLDLKQKKIALREALAAEREIKKKLGASDLASTADGASDTCDARTEDTQSVASSAKKSNKKKKKTEKRSDVVGLHAERDMAMYTQQEHVIDDDDSAGKDKMLDELLNWLQSCCVKKAAFDPASFAPKGAVVAVVMKKSEIKKPQSKKLSISGHHRQLFHVLDVDIPVSVDDVPSAISAVQQRKIEVNVKSTPAA